MERYCISGTAPFLYCPAHGAGYALAARAAYPAGAPFLLPKEMGERKRPKGCMAPLWNPLIRGSSYAVPALPEPFRAACVVPDAAAVIWVFVGKLP